MILVTSCILLVLTQLITFIVADYTTSSKIDTVVVMMLENRAFDHMLGFMTRGGEFGDTRVDGLNGTECNSVSFPGYRGGSSSSNNSHNKTQVCVNDQAQDHCEYDPNHSFAATTERIFNCKWNKTEGTPCTNTSQIDGDAAMQGFVASAISEGHDGLNEMTMWPPEKVPIITTLAKQYALFDRFFASHPGSTYPNRQFVLSGTAHGMTDTGNRVPAGGFPQKTILRTIEETDDMHWRMYYEDSLAWAIFMADVQRNSSKPFIQPMSEFYTAAANGTLANFTFLEPRISPNSHASSDPTYGLANHQHPKASVREGERWMKNVYEALRNGPKWNSTLLIITYDEHGGFYDHVSPPQDGVPNPDGICTKEGFTYTRLGVRIPTIAVSRWIAKGTLVHSPPSTQKPSPTSEYELTSIPATMRKIFPEMGKQGPLTQRDAWAATFEHLLDTTGAEPRSDDDCPKTLPDVPPPPEGELDRQLDQPIDEHALGLIRILCQLTAPKTNGASEVNLKDEKVANSVDGHGFPTVPFDVDAPDGWTVPSEGDLRNCGAGIKTYRDFSPWVTSVWQHWMQDISISEK